MSKICKYTTQGYYCQNIETFSGLSKADKLKKEIAELEKKINDSKSSSTSVPSETDSPTTDLSEEKDIPSPTVDLSKDTSTSIDTSINNLEKSYELSIDEIMKQLID